jgi:CBS domain-containing protein
MGQQDVERSEDERALRRFTRQLLQDVRALEHMIHEDMFETGVRRVGAEQELFMVDEHWQPAPFSGEVLERNEDERVVPELTKFNLEFNLDPKPFGGKCLSEIEKGLRDTTEQVRELVNGAGADLVLTGILPTIHISDLTIENMTPRERYYALNDAIARLRGGPGQFQIRGVDELIVKHDSIMLEGCNTSFQTHFQVSPDEFARFYNIAQAVAAPCMALSVNSPLFFGKRLWRETRIALFQQAVDTRSSNLYLREMSPRVHFGTRWVEESVAEIFKEDISRFRVLLTAEEAEDPFEAMRDGRVPSLQALQLHNGTVYRWNRACYGIYEGKPHLRIENRILPSGPSTIDEVANAAFWFGLVSKLASEYGDIRDVMEFDDAKSNFIAAARLGLGAQITWTNGKQRSADELIAEKLLPMARAGLEDSGVAQSDVDRYIGVLEERVETKQTGAQWMLDSDTAMKKEGATRDERLRAIVAATVARQKEGRPGHEWELAQLSEAKGVRRMRSTRVEHYMTTDLFTVHEDELVEFVACLMDWQHLRHVLVEDEQHRLIGIVSHRSVLRYLAEFGPSKEDEDGVAVSEIMVSDPASIGPDTSTIDAVDLMRRREIGALPVVRDDQLVGIVTGRELMQVARRIMDEDNLREDGG